MLGTIQKTKGIEQGWTGYSGLNQNPSRAMTQRTRRKLKAGFGINLINCFFPLSCSSCISL
jgi:hypothetical protein